MKKKGLFLVILSIVLGAITFFGIFFYIKTLNEEVSVVVAAQDIPPYTEIKENMLMMATKPKHFVDNEAAPKIEYVVGMYTGGNGIFENDVIARYKVKNHDEIKDRVLSKEIPDGARAIAVKIDFVKSVAGIVRPGDYVDVSIVSDKFSVTPVESIKILSVKDSDGYEIDASNKSTVPIPDVVVFEALTPAIRDTIVLISDKGQVHLSLLKPSDVKPTKINQEAIDKIQEGTNQPSFGETQNNNEAVNTRF